MLVIWDVDGTLVDAAGAGHRALVRAVEAVLGYPPDAQGLDYAGRSDRAIIEELLTRSGGRPLTDWPRVRDRYPYYLQDELKHSAGRALPGAASVLAAIDAEPDMAQVLGTGNLEAGAWIKLGHFGLARYFATGGFGDFHRTRPPILAEAWRAAARHYERAFPRAVVVGDTPRDAEAARALGLPVLLVATGRYRRHDLLGFAPRVLTSLTPTDVVLDVLRELGEDGPGL